jgi:polyribonucleotide 5'-hydroxyl-kinase
VFGTALELGERVKISGQKVAVFTWEGCRLEVAGAPDVQYESEDTPMAQFLAAHDTLEARRQAARRAGGEGPRTFVVGPTDAGKSSLCKLLLNYAVRAGWAPAFADLDIGQGAVTVPGCLAASPVEAPVDAEAGLLSDVPLVYYFGQTSPGDNPALYRHLVERLVAALDARGAADAGAAAAGLVFNTMGWVEDLGLELLRHAIAAARADVVLVVGDERLYSRLAGELGGGGGVSVVKLPRSGGVVTRPRELRAAARKARVDEYFYGRGRALAPASQTARAEELEVFRVGGGPKAPPSALPIGAASVADPLKLSRVTNLRDLLFTMVAVSHAPSPDQLLSSNVAGFIYVQDVDVAKGTGAAARRAGRRRPRRLCCSVR